MLSRGRCRASIRCEQNLMCFQCSLFSCLEIKMDGQEKRNNAIFLVFAWGGGENMVVLKVEKQPYLWGETLGCDLRALTDYAWCLELAALAISAHFAQPPTHDAQASIVASTVDGSWNPLERRMGCGAVLRDGLDTEFQEWQLAMSTTMHSWQKLWQWNWDWNMAGNLGLRTFFRLWLFKRGWGPLESWRCSYFMCPRHNLVELERCWIQTEMFLLSTFPKRKTTRHTIGSTS